MQEWYLGWEKVSCLERCPQFRSVLIERAVTLTTSVFSLNKPLLSGAIHLMGTLADAPAGTDYDQDSIWLPARNLTL